ncbi:Na(+)-translocating NADH-quinone reductase subunit C [Corallincola spongiicola]|uniref:Na(+)-translocating NADH-quinone reductase subunit C n=1 Tax=Corallincola spongiicola TaxID=2520508 RepID=A0ABY1WS29_9GAMM|nr:Na(+)-translocating NADH-quinone reductase subunit C [Corallincola spongiicola]TAA47557.1 Na(+)-translocating NADH-quinone reductase subunit C [Corallincola spongiicola]
MSKGNDSIGKTLFVVIALCLVCSLVVSTAAVGLKPKQEENRALDKQRNILRAAGLLTPGANVGEVFARSIEARVINLDTGEYLSDIDGNTFDQRKAAKDPAASVKLTAEDDLASIRRRANDASVYLAKNEQGEVTSVILPVHGYGLWSTMYAFVAIAPDANTIESLVYYDHGETPGLGGEIENPAWAGQWQGKKLFDDQWQPAIKIVKGGAAPGSEYQVDGLSGATLTSNGVQHTFDFWLGQKGFGPYLAKLRQGGLNNG